jgi:hypothetical protein
MENHGGMIPTGEISTRALWQSSQQSYLVANQEELGEGNNKFDLRSDFLHTVKSYKIGPTALLSIRRNVPADFYRP